MSTLYIVEHPMEAETLKAQDSSLLVFVAKSPVFAHRKKPKDVADLRLSDYVFMHSKAYLDLFDAHDIRNIVILAAHNGDGILWLSHWAHYRELNIGTMEDIGETMHIGTYVSLATDCREPTPISCSYLENVFRVSVFNSSVSALFYNMVSKPLGKQLLGSPKTSLSLGALRTLNALKSIDNPRCMQLSVDNVDSNDSKTSTFTFDAYDAPPQPTAQYGVFKLVGKRIIYNNRPQPETTIEIGIRGDIVNATDPYITCLLHTIPLNRYFDLIHRSILSVAVSPELPMHFNNGLLDAIRRHFQYLTSQGVLEGSEFNALNAMLIARPDVRVEDGRAVSTHLCSLGFMTAVIAACTDVISDNFDYAVLYEKFNTNMLLKYAQHPYAEVEYRSVEIACNYESTDANDTSRFLRSQPLNSPPAIIGSDYNKMWHNLIEDSYLFKPDMLSEAVDIDIIDSPRYTAQLMHSLNSVYGYRYSYTYSLLKMLNSRGFLNITRCGVRITPYGYAVASAAELAMGTHSVDSDAYRLDELCLTVNNYIAKENIDSCGKSHGTSFDLAERLGEFLTTAREHLDGIRKSVLAAKTVTIKKKLKSGRTRTYKLVLDRKAKLAYFKTRNGLMSPVWGSIVDRKSVRLGCSDLDIDLRLSKLTVVPPSIFKLTAHESNCPECGGSEYTPKTSATGQLVLVCNGCGTQTDSHFIAQ